MAVTAPPPVKLSWSFDQTENCEIAYHNGYRIRAVRDECHENPFESWDGHWPMVALYDRSLTVYDKVKGEDVSRPFRRFNDHLLLHLQKHLAALIDWTEHTWMRDVDALRENMEPWFEGVDTSTKTLDEWAGLYEMLGIAHLRHTSRGWCGGWIELLIVATPEAIAQHRPDATPEQLKADMESQAELYDAWAWGDVYGYVIEQPSEWDDDGDVTGWEDAPGANSCWGYYGTDHDESGLEAAALESVPDEPAPTPFDMTLSPGRGAAGHYAKEQAA